MRVPAEPELGRSLCRRSGSTRSSRSTSRASTTFYSCSSLEAKLERILRRSARQPNVRVRSVDCQSGPGRAMPRVDRDRQRAGRSDAGGARGARQDKSKRELAARVRGESEDPAALAAVSGAVEARVAESRRRRPGARRLRADRGAAPQGVAEARRAHRRGRHAVHAESALARASRSWKWKRWSRCRSRTKDRKSRRNSGRTGGYSLSGLSPDELQGTKTGAALRSSRTAHSLLPHTQPVSMLSTPSPS